MFSKDQNEIIKKKVYVSDKNSITLPYYMRTQHVLFYIIEYFICKCIQYNTSSS